MILTCPSCGTQYVVKDGAIPPGGRQVRCASCKHSWHQDPDEVDAVEPAGMGEVKPPTDAPAGALAEEGAEAAPEDYSQRNDSEADESLAEATLIEPRSGPEAEERAYEEAELEAVEDAPPPTDSHDEPALARDPYANAQFDIGKRDEPMARSEPDWSAPPSAEAESDEFSPFPSPDEGQPRRRSPVVTAAIVILIIIVLAAAFWLLAPAEWKARLGLVQAGTSPLALVTTHMDRQRLESGNELLTVTGRVINPTGRRQDVPPLQAQLKTKAGKVVYSWTIPAPASSLAPGASAPFNSAEVNPPGGDELTISLGAPS
jgi:predicted Zn finger-like uncharacterized protein